jgi:VIT1/CCC1 family predicted Fe2+/Mn2+ transporter
MNNKVVNKDTITQRDSFSELLGQLANNLATVVHDEIGLVIQGIREKTTAGRSGVITIVIGAGISFAAFMCFCVVLIIGLTSYMALIMASLVTGAALALVGGIIAFIGYRKLKKSMQNT